MNTCYVCEAVTGVARTHSDKHAGGICICSGECEMQYNLLSQLAAASERKPKLIAYSDMSLFEPVDLGLTDTDDENEGPELGSFFGKVCIEAIPAIESEVLFIVKQENDKIVFKPRKTNAMMFDDAAQADKYIRQVLKPRYSEKWNFVIWSHSALSR